MRDLTALGNMPVVSLQCHDVHDDESETNPHCEASKRRY